MYRIDGTFINKKITEKYNNSAINSKFNTIEHFDNVSLPMQDTTMQDTTMQDTTMQDTTMQDTTMGDTTMQNMDINNVPSIHSQVNQTNTMDGEIKFCVEDVCLNMDQISRFKNELEKYNCVSE